MYGCESWTIKKVEQEELMLLKLCCWRRLLRVPWTTKRSNWSILKGNKPWILIGRTDTEAETPILWPPDVNSWLTGKNPDAGEDWRQEEKGTTENEMVGWHHRLNGHEFEHLPEMEKDRGAWRAAVHGVTKSWTQISNSATRTTKFLTKLNPVLKCYC